jgi:hypothetical protein
MKLIVNSATLLTALELVKKAIVMPVMLTQYSA